MMPWVTGWLTNSTRYLNGILGIYKRPAKSATFATASQTRHHSRHYASDCFTACSCSMLFPGSHIVPTLFPAFHNSQLNSSTAPRRVAALVRHGSHRVAGGRGTADAGAQGRRRCPAAADGGFGHFCPMAMCQMCQKRTNHGKNVEKSQAKQKKVGKTMMLD